MLRKLLKVTVKLQEKSDLWQFADKLDKLTDLISKILNLFKSTLNKEVKSVCSGLARVESGLGSLRSGRFSDLESVRSDTTLEFGQFVFRKSVSLNYFVFMRGGSTQTPMKNSFKDKISNYCRFSGNYKACLQFSNLDRRLQKFFVDFKVFSVEANFKFQVHFPT